MLYPKPIIIAVCCAVAMIFGFYLLGKHTLEKNRLPDDPPNTTVEQHGSHGLSMPDSVSKRDSQSKESPPQESPAEHVHTHTESHHHPAVTHSNEITTSQTSTVARYTEGPYKGMTYEQALKVYEWRLRKSELQDRLIEQSKKSRAIARALVASANEELSLIRSAFKLLSPEQLEAARQEALKTLPAADVEKFFSHLANHSTTMTPEQIVEAEKEMIYDRKLLWITSHQIDHEFEQIKKELHEHNSNYP